MKPLSHWYDPQEHYRRVKKMGDWKYCWFAVLWLIVTLIFDRKYVVGALYFFIYGLGYFCGRRSRASE